LMIDVAKASVGDVGSFKVQRDIEPAKGAVGKFVEEFNDAQDYVRSLVAVNNDGENVSAGTFSSNIEISRLGSQLRKLVFGDSYAHSKSTITSDGADITISDNNALNTDIDQLEQDLKDDSALVDGYVVKVNNDVNEGGTAYYIWNAALDKWDNHEPKFSAFRLSDIGLDFGTGSDRLQIKNSAKLGEQLLENPDKVKALFDEAPVESTTAATVPSNEWQTGHNYSVGDIVWDPGNTGNFYKAKTAGTSGPTFNGDIARWEPITAPWALINNDPNNPDIGNAAAKGELIANILAYDNNKDSYRPYQGLTHSLNDFLSNFLSGDPDNDYQGAYKAHINSLQSQNKRIDDRIEDLDRYLEQREKALSQSFIRMEEMQSKLNTQMQTLTNSFAKK